MSKVWQLLRLRVKFVLEEQILSLPSVCSRMPVHVGLGRCNLLFTHCKYCVFLHPLVFFSVTMVMGIPTVKRKVKSYLSETLRSLIDKLSPEEKLDCVIIVYVGEVRLPIYTLLRKAWLICIENKCLNVWGVISQYNLCRPTWNMFKVWLLD